MGWDAYENAAAYQKYSGTKDVGRGTDHFHLRTNAGAEKKSFFLLTSYHSPCSKHLIIILTHEIPETDAPK